MGWVARMRCTGTGWRSGSLAGAWPRPARFRASPGSFMGVAILASFPPPDPRLAVIAAVATQADAGPGDHLAYRHHRARPRPRRPGRGPARAARWPAPERFRDRSAAGMDRTCRRTRG